MRDLLRVPVPPVVEVLVMNVVIALLTSAGLPELAGWVFEGLAASAARPLVEAVDARRPPRPTPRHRRAGPAS